MSSPASPWGGGVVGNERCVRSGLDVWTGKRGCVQRAAAGTDVQGIKGHGCGVVVTCVVDVKVMHKFVRFY